VDAAEAVGIDVALAAYTIEAARAIGLEGECGSLEPGKRADLVILDRDPLATPPAELIRLRVVGTFVAGRQAWPEPGTSGLPGALSQ
jgi:predicted amidohydrolase YtcJ